MHLFLGSYEIIVSMIHLSAAVRNKKVNLIQKKLTLQDLIDSDEQFL